MKTFSEFINEGRAKRTLAKRRIAKLENNFRQCFLSGTPNDKIKSFVIMSAENPRNHVLSDMENNRRTTQLCKTLQKEGYAFIPCLGRFKKTDEHSVVVINIDLNRAKELCYEYDQLSLIYCVFEDGNIQSNYWILQSEDTEADIITNPYVNTGETIKWNKRKLNSKDDFTLVGSGKKYNFKFTFDDELFNGDKYIVESFCRVIDLLID